MTNALHIKNLSKTYSNGHSAIRDIDLTVKQGDFYALLGPNGAGKSTLIGILCSLVTKSKGSVEIFGYEISSNFPKAKSYLGVVPQEFNFNIFETPLQIISNQAGYYGINRSSALEQAKKYLKMVELWEKRNECANDLSGGMKRRLMIARALVHEPKILILDEPTAGMDIEIRLSMWDFLKKINSTGTTIILTTHYLEEAENLCRSIGIIDNGRIIENTSMKDLLGRLNVQTYIFDLSSPITVVPQSLADITTLVDSTTIEVKIPSNQNLNNLYKTLSSESIMVESMRSKTNRLEQLFMSLIDRKSS